MTTLTKQADPQTAHLTPEDIEQLGVELDTIRQDVLDDRGARDAAYIRRVIAVQRRLELGGRAVLLGGVPPPGCSAPPASSVAKILENMEIGHNVLHGQWDWMRDPKIHSTTWEWDHVIARRAVEAHPQRAAPHASRTSSARTTTSATGSCGSTRTSRGRRATSCSRSGTSLNACFFEYGIAIYDLDLGDAPRRSAGRTELRRASGKTVRQGGQQAAKDYVAHPAARRAVRWRRPWRPTSPPTSSATSGRTR